MDPINSQLFRMGGDSTHWIATLGGAGIDYGYGIAVDSSGNVYVTGYTASQGAGAGDILIAKYNTSGTIQWQRTLGGADSDGGNGIAVDSSGNVYVTGYTVIGSNDILIAKYNTSGTIEWQRRLGGTGTDYGYGIAVDSSGNVYVTGSTTQGAGAGDILITKYNTSGTIQWQRTLGGTGSDRGQGIAVDSSGNVYVTGYTASQGAGAGDILIAKYNTSGTIQWQRTLGGADSDGGNGIAVDSSGNVYVTGYTTSQGAGLNDLLIAKYNTSGTIQWQRTLGGTDNDIGNGIAVDSSGNVYVIGSTRQADYDILIAKYNTSGTIQWQRGLGGTNDDRGQGIAVDSSGNVYVTGYTASQGAGAEDILIAKLPDNGSKTGTYGNLLYASRALTGASSTLTDASSTLTDASSSMGTTSTTLTDASSTLTSTTTTI